MTIDLQCPNCRKIQTVSRCEFDPPNAVLVAIICLDCDDGDRHSPEFFDAAGNWIDPAIAAATGTAKTPKAVANTASRTRSFGLGSGPKQLLRLRTRGGGVRRLSHKELREGWKITDPSAGDPVAYLRDLDGTGSYHVCVRGDPGAFPVFAHNDQATVAEACAEVIARERGECGQWLAMAVARAAMEAIADRSPTGPKRGETRGSVHESSGGAANRPKDVA